MSGIDENSIEQQLNAEQSLQSGRLEREPLIQNHEPHTPTRNESDSSVIIDSSLLSNNESLAEMNCEDEEMPKKRKRETPIDDQEDCKEELSPSIKIHKATESNDTNESGETKTVSDKVSSSFPPSSSSSDVVKPLTHLCLSLLSSTYQEKQPSLIQNDISAPFTPTTIEANSVSVPSPSTKQTNDNGSRNKNILSPCEPPKNSSSTPPTPTPTISEDPSSDQKIFLSPATPIPSASKSFDTSTTSLSSASNESSSSSKTSNCSSETTTTTTSSSASKESLPSPIPYKSTPSESENASFPSTPTFSSENKLSSKEGEAKPSPITFPNLMLNSSPNNINNSTSNPANESNEVAEFNNLEECLLEIRRLRKENEEIKQRSAIELDMLRTQLALAQKENKNDVNSANENNHHKSQSSQSVTAISNKLPTTGVSWFQRSQNARAECMRTLENESLGIDHLVNELASINRTLSLQLTKMKSSLG